MKSCPVLFTCLKRLGDVESDVPGLNLRDRRSTLAMARGKNGRRSIFRIWVCVCVTGATCGSCLKRAGRGLKARDKRSTVEIVQRFRGRRNLCCIWAGVCVAGAAFGSCLKGLDVVDRVARRLNLRDRRSAALWRWHTDFVVGAVFSASGCVFAWQGQHLATA